MPTVYLVEEPLSCGALPGDHLIHWAERDWTMQRQVQPTDDDMGYLKLLHYHSSPPVRLVAGLLRRLPWLHRPRAERPEKAPQRPC